MIRAWRSLAILLALWLVSPLVHATVRATLDRSTAHLGETVTLNLHSDTAPIGTPDLSALSQDFQVLGQSSGTTTSFVNGQRTVDYSYGVALRPLHEGTLKIPPITVGTAQTQPLTLQVTPASQGGADVHGPVFIDASVDPREPYVGQQVALSVKLYYTTNLANASLSPPAFNGADVSLLGSDLDYQAQRNGRTYNVIERRYAVVPQHAGELTMAPIVFQGDLLDPNDPDSFLGMGSPVQAQSNPLTLQVKPPPASWGPSAWLPARQLSLSADGWPDNSAPARVGQPFNLTLGMQASGLSFEALPPLTLPALDGATAYPDKPVTGNRVDGGWIEGRREHRFAVVPSRAGTLTIPAITVRWWNVVTDQAETATIPAHQVRVLPGAGAVAAASPPAAAFSTGGAAASAGDSKAASPLRAGGFPWAKLALASVGLWLLTLLVWALRAWRRRHAGTTTVVAPRAAARPPPRSYRDAFLQAVRGGDADAQAQALLAWARSERPGLRHLEAVAAALAADEQRAAIAALERRRYATAGAAADPSALENAFAGGFAWRSDDAAAGGDEPLPPLYPFKLH